MLLKMKNEPSRLQFGASKCSGAIYATRRSPESTATVSSVLYSVGLRRGGCRHGQLNFRKHRLLDDIFVVRADTDPDVEVSLQRHAQPAARDLGLAVRSGQGHINVIAPFCDTQSSGAGQIRLDLSRERSLFIAILQRGHSNAVQRHVGIHGIRVEALPEHQYCFLMRISGGSRETRCQRSE